jgi:hypothetical protein
VRVGDGRGFVVAAPLANYVITAAHVLPHLPPVDLSVRWKNSSVRLFVSARERGWRPRSA